MQILNQIDQLIKSLNELKPLLSADTSSNKEKFDAVLKTSLESSLENDVLPSVANEKELDQVPNWVDTSYVYDAANPRKPNMREMMQALSGKDAEDIYEDAQSDFQSLSKLASELLYGLVGSNKDTRDWNAIMNSEDIAASARAETNMMFKPVIDIASDFGDNNLIKSQYAVIKASSGEVLKTLMGSTESMETTLTNYGITKVSVPTNLQDKIIVSDFDTKVLKLLDNLPEKQEGAALEKEPRTLESLALKSQMSALSTNIANAIPQEEIEKL